jgi:hypothetical protein
MTPLGLVGGSQEMNRVVPLGDLACRLLTAPGSTIAKNWSYTIAISWYLEEEITTMH